ncbi:hypothetical protein GOODEAATRI_033507, partial [Goodea atripinnis]
EDSSKAIKSIWSTSRRPQCKTGRIADHSVLAGLARSANTCDNSTINFGLLNICSLTNKNISFRISSRTVSLTFSAELKPGNNPVTFLNSMILPLLGLFTSANHGSPAGEEVSP